MELAELARKKQLAGVQGSNRLHRAMRNDTCFSAVTHNINGTKLSWEEFRDDFCLRYGLMPQDIPATCDGCGKRFLIEHYISCPKAGLILVRHNEDAKEWGSLGARSLTPSAITY